MKKLCNHYLIKNNILDFQYKILICRFLNYCPTTPVSKTLKKISVTIYIVGEFLVRFEQFFFYENNKTDHSIKFSYYINRQI